ncbi:F-box/WD repeat-containing protein 7 (F-box and WD-40 domain-containing protein 7) [Durusdinium trenchii]|uniref:F-box/WD repeat-containing protein 7 (F-box and WD-40 domain-containing protein 7) n=1 Tax=Durusdinium trenchii TaxID=1381693 RepID=A0ABP0PJ70_9DINO
MRSDVDKNKAQTQPRVMLWAARKRVAERREVRAVQAKFAAGVDHFDGVTHLCLAEQNAQQAVVIRRGEQSWDIAKQLRAMSTTVRRAAERKKESVGVLEGLEQRIYDLQDFMAAEPETEGDEEAAAAVGKLRRGQARKLQIADNEIDAQLVLLDAQEQFSQGCPSCGRMVLNEFLRDHVRNCEAKKAKLEVQQRMAKHRAGADGVTQKYLALEKEMQRKLQARRSTITAEKEKTFIATVEVCVECGKQVLASHMARHVVQCRNRERVRIQGTMVPASQAVMRPQAPQSLRIVAVTSTTIEVEWEPPIFTGGFEVAIHDYVIEYAVGGVEQPPMSTSRFCKVVPVCGEHRFQLDGLRGETEYTNIRVRCVNSAGSSAPSNVLASVSTDQVEPPSVPQMLMLAKVSTSTLTFCWSAPRTDGGAAISKYEVSFSMYVKGTGLGEKKRLRRETAEVAATRHNYVLEGLFGGTKVWDVSVVAVTEFVNRHGEKQLLRSAPSNEIQEVVTLEPSQEMILRDEIRRVSNLQTATVDSKVYMGFAQRYSKADLLDKLNKDLVKNFASHKSGRRTRNKEPTKTLIPVVLLREAFGYQGRRDRRVSQRTAQRLANNAEVKSRRTLVEANKALGLDTVWRRRKQFEYRMGKLKEKLDVLEKERASIILRRTLLTKELEKEEKHLGVLFAEYDRVLAHNGEFFDSDVMHHGRKQRFHTWSLKAALEEELRHGKERISKGKREQVEIHRRIIEINAELGTTEEALKDRKARLVAFENEVVKKDRALEMVRAWRQKSVSNTFEAWKVFTEQSRATKASSRRVIRYMQNLNLFRAWATWCAFCAHQVEVEASKANISGLGSFLLSHAQDDRQDLHKEAGLVLDAVRGAAEELDSSKQTLSQLQDTADAHAARSTDLKAQEVPDRQKKLAFAAVPEIRETSVELRKGQAYLDFGDFRGALRSFEKHLQDESPTLHEMCEAYHGLARSMQGLSLIDKAIVNFERMRSLAKEAELEKMEALALLGVAQCQFESTFYKAAIEFADRALLKFEDLNDRFYQGRACRELERAYGAIYDEDRQVAFRQRADNLEKEMDFRLGNAHGAIRHAEQKLISVTADTSQEYKLEVVSAKVPQLRAQIEQKRLAAEEIIKLSNRYQRENEIGAQRLKEIAVQLETVRQCKQDELDSDLVHGIMQRFKVRQLLENLEDEGKKLNELIDVRTKERSKTEIRASNALDDMRDLEQDLSVELGDLMRKVVKGQHQFRCAALNPANVRSRNVQGMATGGIERMVACIKDSIYVFDIRDGALLKILHDEEDRQRSITCLFYAEHRILCGGVDHTVRVWDDHHLDDSPLRLRGHEGTIWSLYADAKIIISGSADKTVRFWRPSGRCVRIIDAVHSKAVTSLAWDPHTGNLATASPDHSIKVYWDVTGAQPKSKESKGLYEESLLHAGQEEVRQSRFVGHKCPVSCVTISGTELISGGEDGRLLIWDIQDTSLLHVCEGHTAPIRAIQADATKVVSGSLDNNICVFDVATGNTLITLRGHQDSILALQFDLNHILSVATDATMRLWSWGSGGKTSVDHVGALDKLHILQPKETLSTLEKRYGTPVKTLMKWNNLQSLNNSSNTLYVGMRLIVQRQGRVQLEGTNKGFSSSETSKSETPAVSRQDQDQPQGRQQGQQEQNEARVQSA